METKAHCVYAKWIMMCKYLESFFRSESQQMIFLDISVILRLLLSR